MTRMSLLLGLALLFTASCAMVQDDLRRATQSYEEARYEDANVWLEDLETSAPSMDLDSRAQYYYLRGMTEYRLGHRLYALHYLALARELVERDRADLRAEWTQIMTNTLAELTPRGRTWLPPEAPAAQPAVPAPAEAAPSGGA